MSIFRSDKAAARVSFPPEQFGFGEGIETIFDPASGTHIKRKAPYRPVKFKDGMAEVADARMPLMRKHRGNRANGGNVFWEQSEADTKAFETLFIKSAELPEGGLTNEDRELLVVLKRHCKHIAPPESPNARERIAKAIERFRVRGIDPCPPQFTLARIKARAVELMGMIEDRGIWSAADEGPSTADGSTGSSE